MKREFIFVRLSILLFAFIIFYGCDNKKKEVKKNVNSAKLIFAIGDVKVKDKDKDNWNNAKQDMILTEGTEIKTGSGSQCNIVIGKDSFISVKQKSHLILSTLFKDVSGIEKNTLDLKVGKGVFNPKKLMKGGSFRIKTPTAIAAVRGTQFIVETQAKGKLKVAVVEGKVELRRHIPVLDNVKSDIIEKSETLSSLKAKVESEKIIIDANESAYINNKMAEHENKIIEDVVNKHVKEINALEEKKDIAADENANYAKNKEIEKTKIESSIKKELNNLNIMKLDNKQKVKEIVLTKKIIKEDIEDVKELNKFIHVIKKNNKVPAQFVEGTKLTIVSPVYNSRIYINSVFKGRNTITVYPGSEKVVNVEVKAPGFKKYNYQIKLQKGEKKQLRVTLERLRNLDRVKWSSNFGSSASIKPVYYNNLLIIANNNGNVTAVDRNGNRKWKINLKRNIESVPAISAGNLYVISNSGDFYSIKVNSGKINWKRKVNGTLLFRSKPVIAENKIIFGTSYGIVYAFSIDGKELWQKNIENGIYSSPVYNQGKIYLGAEDHNIYSIDAKDGDINWKYKVDSRLVSSSPVISGNTLFIGCYSGSFYAIDIKNGDKKWSIKTGKSVFSTPVVNKDKVFFGSNDGNIYALSINNGSIIWKYNTGNKIITTPVVNKNLILVTSGKKLLAFDIKNGKKQWVHLFNSNVKTSATAVGNDIYIGLDSGEVTSLRNSLKDIRK